MRWRSSTPRWARPTTTPPHADNAVDQEVYDGLIKDVADLDKKIERAQQVIKLKATLAKPVEGQQKLCRAAASAS
jgi:hypothetical protein